MPKLTIDGKEIEVEEGTTVIQACEALGIEIPRFCYHSRLAIAGNCRMCLVEMDKSPKPIASCCQPAQDKMVIHTNTPMVKKAREGVMEFLLINHPLDCPICDQGGECDLQDQAMLYGKDKSRMCEDKRAVVDKDFGPLVKTHMTRCIHCTRCVRFITDVAGVNEIATLNRGEHMEIATYIEKSIKSELSGNIIDLCPVGALTSKPYEFKARSWELEKTESIDVLDAVGSNIRIDSRGMEVMRILPRLNEDINEEWISDKTRFAYDGLTKQRLTHPYIRKDGKLYRASWGESFAEIKNQIEKLRSSQIAAISGDLVDVESMLMLKNLLLKLNCKNFDCRQQGEKISNKTRADYLFNTSISGIEEADFCLLIGTNPRLEASIVNARIKKQHLSGKLKIALIGEQVDLTYNYQYLGNELSLLEQILADQHPINAELRKAKKPMVILGNKLSSLPDGEDIINLVKLIAEKYNFIQADFNGYNFLNTDASRVGGLDIGFIPPRGGAGTDKILDQAEKGEIKLVYLLGADEIDVSKLKNSFVIYQGHHGDKAANIADVILPGAAYTEKDATYVNLEGRAQHTYRAVFAPGEAKNDWQIIVELAEYIGYPLEFKNLNEIRANLAKISPNFAQIGELIISGWSEADPEYKIKTKIINFKSGNYFLSNSICRASPTMAKCAALRAEENIS